MSLQDEIDELRENLAEVIPEGGEDTDTLFTNAKLTKWLESGISLNQASLRGWQAKLGHYAGLVDVADGASSRKMGDLFDHAERMIKMYTGLVKGPTAGRSRVGKIVRSL